MDSVRILLKTIVNSVFAFITIARIKLQKSPTLIILTYHRVLPPEAPGRLTEQPGMVISPDSLNRHFQLLKGLGAVFLPLKTWLDRSRSGGSLPLLSVAVTFDDGWRDNYLHAFPVLTKHEVPATIFLVSKRLGTSWLFWPERILHLLLHHYEKLSLPEYQWLTPYCEQVGWDGTLPLSPEQADLVVSELKELDDERIERLLARSERSSPVEAYPQSDRTLLNISELQEMKKTGLVDYGAHTQHHYRLDLLNNSEKLSAEIIGCREDLESLGLGPTAMFCYPNGNISPTSETLVKENYEAACTTHTGWNPPRPDYFRLNRFNLHDGNAGTAVKLLSTLMRIRR